MLGLPWQTISAYTEIDFTLTDTWLTQIGMSCREHTVVRQCLPAAVTAYHDGRVNVAENFKERTRGRPRHRLGGADRHAAAGRGTRRVLALPGRLVDPLDGRTRLYYEMTQLDGSHALVTELR